MGRTAAVDPPMYEGTPMYMYVRYITTLRQGTAHECTRAHTSALRAHDQPVLARVAPRLFSAGAEALSEQEAATKLDLNVNNGLESGVFVEGTRHTPPPAPATCSPPRSDIAGSAIAASAFACDGQPAPSR